MHVLTNTYPYPEALAVRRLEGLDGIQHGISHQQDTL